MADRYCMKCGQELVAGDRFCTGCGSPVRQGEEMTSAQAAPVYPERPRASSPPGGDVASLGRTKVRTAYYWAAFVVLSVLALLLGDNGTLVGLIAATVAALWTYRDAASRGMDRAGLWAVGVFLLLIVFLPLYLFMRRPRGV